MTDTPPPPWIGEPASTTASPASRIRGADGLLVCADFDGTLADITSEPDRAEIRPASRRALASLVDRPRTAVAVVSGRALDDVRERVGLDGVTYAGNHGLEIETPTRRFVHPGTDDAAATIATTCADLRERLADVPGVIVEEKGLTASVHYRKVPRRNVGRVDRAVRAAAGEHDDSIQLSEGKEVFELRPAVDWDKGRAVEWLRDVLVPDGESWHPTYVGDDVTDEDAFRALAGEGTTVRVGDDGDQTDADYLVGGPGAVTALFEWLSVVRNERVE